MKDAPYEQFIAGSVAAKAVELGRQLCRSPVEGETLDATIETYIRDSGCTPALKGYKPPFTDQVYNHTICLALNNEAVHGVPKKLVTPSDLITIDLVVEYNGWFADTARTFTWSTDKDGKNDFCMTSRAILTGALQTIHPHGLINSCASIIEYATLLSNFSIIKEFCGHSIGREIHEEPQIPNYKTQSSARFEPGRSYAIEPVLAINTNYQLFQLNDGWTIAANCLTSHFEDTIFVTDTGIQNLTRLPPEKVL